MTTPPAPPTPPHPLAEGHLDPTTLADLSDGSLDAPQSERARTHLGSCARCQARSDALAAVPAWLRQSADVGDMPVDVARRLDAALTDALTDVALIGASVPGGATARRRRPVPWRTRVLQAAAVVVLVLGVGGIGYSIVAGSGGGNSGGSSAASVPQAGRDAGGGTAYPVTRSGRDYTADTLAAAVPGLVTRRPLDSSSGPQGGEATDGGRTGGSAARGSTGASGGSGGSGAGDGGDARLNGGAALASCVANLAGGPVTPLAVDIATYGGQPATIIVLPTPDDPSKVDAFAVEPTCPPGVFLHFVRVARPGR